MPKFEEYAGIRNLVYAELTETVNPSTGVVTETYGTVKPLSGVQSVSGEVNESSETHYYDDMSAIVVDSEGDDTYTIVVSVPTKAVRADIEGLTYDSTTGALIGSKKVKKYFALGFIAGKLNGVDEYNWILKGKFSGGNKTHNTKTDSVDATNMEYTYTSISTATKFTKGGNVKYLSVDDDGKCDLSNFFSQVTTPDTLTPASGEYDLTITKGEGTTVTVTKNGSPVTAGTNKLASGDVITITVTGGTITVNGSTFTSGNTHTVTGDVTIVSTATA